MMPFPRLWLCIGAEGQAGISVPKPAFGTPIGTVTPRRSTVIKRIAYGFCDDAYFLLKIRTAFPANP